MSRRSASAEPGFAPPRLTLELRNPVKAPAERRLVRQVVLNILAAEPVSGPLHLAVHLVDDERIRTINREQRGIDATTDVLSFPLLTDEPTFVLPPDEPRHLGDVLISFPRAAAQAADYGHRVDRELYYLLAHGVLHLLGYDHVDEAERLAMRQREEAALVPLGLTR